MDTGYYMMMKVKKKYCKTDNKEPLFPIMGHTFKTIYLFHVPAKK